MLRIQQAGTFCAGGRRYGIAFYFLSLTLRFIPAGIVYAVWSSVGTILITLKAWLLYGQKLDLPALLGMRLIIAAMVVLNSFSKSVSH